MRFWGAYQTFNTLTLQRFPLTYAITFFQTAISNQIFSSCDKNCNINAFGVQTPLINQMWGSGDLADRDRFFQTIPIVSLDLVQSYKLLIITHCNRLHVYAHIVKENTIQCTDDAYGQL